MGIETGRNLVGLRVDEKILFSEFPVRLAGFTGKAFHFHDSGYNNFAFVSDVMSGNGSIRLRVIDWKRKKLFSVEGLKPWMNSATILIEIDKVISISKTHPDKQHYYISFRNNTYMEFIMT